MREEATQSKEMASDKGKVRDPVRRALLTEWFRLAREENASQDKMTKRQAKRISWEIEQLTDAIRLL
jgi:hypothetical protein